ncbi:hypothetical protein CW682_00230 [Macrococcoides caseolyticum]|uniref:Uncharacterized protein n=1 Tax=Macrococcoides caseolyticum TaxID=69966 RepID=A0ACC9MUN8_9STAP|nr:hypothetical protein CW682_00230 [Macrococcus caseolyticus]
MWYKFIIHCSIVLTALYLANEINIFGIKIEFYQSFLMILILFHLNFKIKFLCSENKYFKNAIRIEFRI